MTLTMGRSGVYIIQNKNYVKTSTILKIIILISSEEPYFELNGDKNVTKSIINPEGLDGI